MEAVNSSTSGTAFIKAAQERFRFCSAAFWAFCSCFVCSTIFSRKLFYFRNGIHQSGPRKISLLLCSFLGVLLLFCMQHDLFVQRVVHFSQRRENIHRH